MLERPSRKIIRQGVAGLGLMLVLATLGACERGKERVRPTACIGDQPALPRIVDPAPPNCPD